MKIVILSPHTDDAIFSLGDYIQTLEDVTILSIFSGIPPIGIDNGRGYKKHVLLNQEHEEACEVLGVKFENGGYLDDVYKGSQPRQEQLLNWLEAKLVDYDVIIAPLGIHHPDHIFLRDTLLKSDVIEVDKWYRELPYGELYPKLAKQIVEEKFAFPIESRIYEKVTGLKKKAIMCYKSQIKSDHILYELLVPEYLYSYKHD